jgi:hypothetical protein
MTDREKNKCQIRKTSLTLSKCAVSVVRCSPAFARDGNRGILKKAAKIHSVFRCKRENGTQGHGLIHRDKHASVKIMSI